MLKNLGKSYRKNQLMMPLPAHSVLCRTSNHLFLLNSVGAACLCVCVCVSEVTEGVVSGCWILANKILFT